MNAFRDLGIRTELADAAAAAGFDAPSPVQCAAIPVLRRGANAVLVASSGSGVTAAWALGLLDRLLERDAGDDASAAPDAEAAVDADAGDAAPARPRALVLTTTEERAARVARAIVTLSSASIDVRALTAAWSARAGNGIVVAPIGAVMRAIAESTLKLSHLETIVFDHLSALLATPDGAGFETIGAVIPGDTQRIVVTPEWTKQVERFAEAHARRAITYPPRQADPALAIKPRPSGTLSYIVTGESEKPDALARVLRRPRADAPLVVTRSAARARHAAGEMRARGFIIGEARGPGIDAILSPSAEAERPLIAYDVPFDAQSLAGMDLDDGLVLVEPRELAHLHSIASEAGITVKAVGGRQPRGATAAFLEEIRSAIGEQDIDAQLALIDPLFDEHSAAEVAAALCALLRARRTAGAGSAAREEPTDRPMAFVRLFVSAGQRDNIRPADLVGAITGEASITGDQIGKIDMRDTFSVVEVASDAAERVIHALNGTTLRGRSLRVDYDRRGSAPPQRSRGTARPHRS